jgi:hypothetical protein
MSVTSTRDLSAASARRLSLWSMFELQLVVSPLFLAPLYLPGHVSAHPYVHAISFLLAPIVYVAALELLFTRSHVEKWPVLAAARRGGAWGVVFGLLSMVPAQLWEQLVRSAHWRIEFMLLGNLFNPSVRAQVWARPGDFLAYLAALILGLPVLILFVLLHYALIGAAVGGVAGLVKDHRRRVVLSIEESTQY